MTLQMQSSQWSKIRLRQPDLQSVLKWVDMARPAQLQPGGDWLTWLMMAGRGFGKTRAGAEWAKMMALLQPGTRGAIVAPTFGDVRDTCIEGVSGFLSVTPHELIDDYNSGRAEIKLKNGTRIKGFSGDTPNRLRGPQHHWAWADEVSSWRYEDTLDQLLFGLRLGKRPRMVATTTPKVNLITRRLLEDESTRITRGSTFDNAANLSEFALKQLKEKYEGTRLGRQELYAEFLDDILGALWTRAMLDAANKSIPRPAMQKISISVDPSGSDGETGDMQGIIPVGLGVDGRGYVLGDWSIQGSPDEWSQQVVDCYDHFKADNVVAESNYGGAMVKYTIKTKRANIPVKMVDATRGKHVRAEPIAALYEQGKVSHLAEMRELEDQMTMMTSEGYVGRNSPDRVDALVWGLTHLMVTPNILTVRKMKMG